MLRARPLLLGCTCLAVVTSLSAAPSDAPPPVDPYAQLSRENAALSRENAELKRQVADLKAQVQRLERQLARPNVLPRPNVPQPFDMPGTQRRSAPGPDWIPREFNGRTFYIVPCEAGTAPRATAAITVITGTLAAPTTRPSGK